MTSVVCFAGDTDGRVTGFATVPAVAVSSLRARFVPWLLSLLLGLVVMAQLLSWPVGAFAPSSSLYSFLLAFRLQTCTGASNAWNVGMLHCLGGSGSMSRFWAALVIIACGHLVLGFNLIARASRRAATSQAQAALLQVRALGADASNVASLDRALQRHSFSAAALALQARVWRGIAWLLRALLWVTHGLGMIPVLESVATATACNRDSDSMVLQPATQCMSQSHVGFLLLAALGIALYAPSVVRLARTGGDAARVLVRSSTARKAAIESSGAGVITASSAALHGASAGSLRSVASRRSAWSLNDTDGSPRHQRSSRAMWRSTVISRSQRSIGGRTAGRRRHCCARLLSCSRRALCFQCSAWRDDVVLATSSRTAAAEHQARCCSGACNMPGTSHLWHVLLALALVVSIAVMEAAVPAILEAKGITTDRLAQGAVTRLAQGVAGAVVLLLWAIGATLWPSHTSPTTAGWVAATVTACATVATQGILRAIAVAAVAHQALQDSAAMTAWEAGVVAVAVLLCTVLSFAVARCTTKIRARRMAAAAYRGRSWLGSTSAVAPPLRLLGAGGVGSAPTPSASTMHRSSLSFAASSKPSICGSPRRSAGRSSRSKSKPMSGSPSASSLLGSGSNRMG